jgi:hypothetical protein
MRPLPDLHDAAAQAEDERLLLRVDAELGEDVRDVVALRAQRDVPAIAWLTARPRLAVVRGEGAVQRLFDICGLAAAIPFIDKLSAIFSAPISAPQDPARGP